MGFRRWRLGACAFLTGGAYACSSGSILITPDAATPDAHAPAGGDAASPLDATVTDAGVDASSPGDSGAPAVADAAPDVVSCAWDGSYESPACATCLRAKCCAPVGTCEGDPACVALDVCVNQCVATGGGDAGSVSTCAQSCNDSSPVSVRAEWKALSDCLQQSCANGGAGPCL